MSWKSVRNKYHLLGAEERFRLLLAANGRDDQSEIIAIKESADKSTYEMPSYTPYMEAFATLAMGMFVELLEVAAFHRDCWERYSDAIYLDSIQHLIQEENERNDDEEDDLEFGLDVEVDAETLTEDDDESEVKEGGSDAEEDSMLNREKRLAQGTAFLLLVKYRGWAAFCEQMQIPPQYAWEDFPGSERLIKSIKRAEMLAFNEEEMIAWMMDYEPKATKVIQAETITKTIVETFREITSYCAK